jgi:hypothetical protein
MTPVRIDCYDDLGDGGVGQLGKDGMVLSSTIGMGMTDEEGKPTSGGADLS